jgi:hypothetical protein
MPNRSEGIRHGKATRCAVCDGKFGLVRYYSWRTPLCSRTCIDRFKARRESDRNGCPGFTLLWTLCQRIARGSYDVPDLTARQEILENGADVAPRCSSHDRLCDCGSAQRLAEDYERRAQKASQVDAAKALARSAADPQSEWYA